MIATLTLVILLLVLVLTVLSFLTGVVTGYALAANKKTPEKSAGNENLSPEVYARSQTEKLLDQEKVEKHTPTSYISKFPNPEILRNQKDKAQLEGYLEDMRKGHSGGSFAL